MSATDLTDEQMEAAPFVRNLPVPLGGLVRLGELRDLLEELDGLPDNALITVQGDMIHYEEP